TFRHRRMNPVSRSERPSRPERAWTATFAAADGLPLPSKPVWSWLPSCRGFARSRQGSQDAVRPATAGRAAPANCYVQLIGDLWLQLARLRDQLLDGLFGWEDANQLSPRVHFFHALGKPRRVAMREFAHRGGAGGAHQPDLGPAHAGNAHIVGYVRPFQ